MAALSQVEQGDIRQTPSHCFMSELSTHSFQQGRRDLTLTRFPSLGPMISALLSRQQCLQRLRLLPARSMATPNRHLRLHLSVIRWCALN